MSLIHGPLATSRSPAGRPEPITGIRERQSPSRMTALSVAMGERLRELRQDAELTQAEVARRMGVDRAHVTRAERGVHTLGLDFLERYAKALELDCVTVLALVDVEGLVAIDFPAWQGPNRWWEGWGWRSRWRVR